MPNLRRIVCSPSKSLADELLVTALGEAAAPRERPSRSVSRVLADRATDPAAAAFTGGGWAGGCFTGTWGTFCYIRTTDKDDWIT